MPRSYRYLLSALAVFVLATVALGACGQRGPLYMPDEQKAGRNELKIDNRTPSETNDASKRRSSNQQ